MDADAAKDLLNLAQLSCSRGALAPRGLFVMGLVVAVASLTCNLQSGVGQGKCSIPGSIILPAIRHGAMIKGGVVQDRAAIEDTEQVPAFEDSLGAIIFETKEAIVAPMRPKLRDYGITEPQWRVMRVLGERGEADAGVLSEVGMLHVPSVTRILRDLDRRNLIVRRSDANDRRRTLISLSPEGREIHKALSRHVRRLMIEFRERFGAERLERLVNELKVLSVLMKDIE